MKNTTHRSNIYTYFNLGFVLFYESIFAAALLLMPFSVLEKFPTYSLMSGIFVELEPMSAAWMTVGFLACAWSLMFITGLVVGSARSDDPKASTDSTEYAVKGGPVPAKIQDFLDIPVSIGQLFLFTSLALPGIVVVIANTKPEDAFGAILYSVVFGFISYIMMVIISYPGYAIDSKYRLLRGTLPRLVWGGMDRIGFIRIGFVRLWWAVSATIRFFGFPKILLDKEGQMAPLHFFAMTNFLLTTAIFYLIAYAFPYNPNDIMPAGVYFFLAMTLVIWIFGALHFQLSRFRISPILFLGAVMFIGYPINNVHHTFDVFVENIGENEALLLPEDVVKTSKAPIVLTSDGRETKNLVVVTCTGGGILASGWFTLSMKELIEDRPELRNEVRLLSTVSGSSTGAAFYLDGLLRYDVQPNASERETNRALKSIFDASVETSLEASTYGIAYLDFWRMVTGGLLPFGHRDRGIALSEAWQRNASAFPGGNMDRRVRGFRDGISAGQIPAVIFNTTVMEVGRRVMVTPIDFQMLDASNAQERARDISGYLDPSRQDRVDLSIWSAARISATFPYVTPAARPRFIGAFESDECEYQNRRENHFIDGGYYDNFGVASAMDWLDPVMEARLAGELDFDRLLIIQLRAFKVGRPGDTGGSSAAKAAIAGPIVGMASVYSGAAITRDEIALTRYLENWDRVFNACGEERPLLKTAILERPVGSGPLSWHLTERQIEDDLELYWEKDEELVGDEPITLDYPVDSPVLPKNPSLQNRRIWISKFLAGELDPQ